MVTYSIEEVQAHLDAILQQVRDTGERVVITIDGKPVAAPINRLHFLLFEEMEANGGLLRDTEEYLTEVVDKGYITRQEILDARQRPQ
jgi:prevent-host-death family protein